MLQPKDEQHYQILRAISVSSGIVGSGTISQSLREAGLDLSEATVGRILRELDREGYTARDGFKGRVLTDSGKRRLQKLTAQHTLQDRGNRFLAVLTATGEQELVDILVARKAMERELARLSATQIGEREIQELKEIVQRHRVLAEKGGVGAEEDVQFHRVIARASGNKVLQAAMELVRHDGQLSPALHYIRMQVKSTVVDDHIRILRCLENKDADAAEQAMVLHLENLIRDVKTYWAQYQRHIGNHGEEGSL